MNVAVECAERGDYKGFWEACEMFPEDWLTIYWKATCLSSGYGCEQDIAQGNRLATEILSSVMALAQKGDAVAQHKLGVLYDHGWGVEKDAVHAAMWYRKAAEQGHVNAQFNLACMYDNGLGVKKDEAQAVEWYRKAAEQGDADAQCNLGWRYANGRGVEKDEAQAAEWYRKAAEQGNADAQFNLACMYDNGLGVKKDEAQAVEWYRKAAEQGDADAQYNLGLMYANGRGVEKDEAQAVEWYRKAAEQGNEGACRLLKTTLEYLDTKKKINQAEKEIERLEKVREDIVGYVVLKAESGDPEAQFVLGSMYEKGDGVEKDDAQAVFWYRKAAEQCDADACHDLAMMYFSGRGVPKDINIGSRLLRQAAEGGHLVSQRILGYGYALGFKGFQINMREALIWLKMAANQKDACSIFLIGLAYESGECGVKNLTEANRWYAMLPNLGTSKDEVQKKLVAIVKQQNVTGRNEGEI